MTCMAQIRNTLSPNMGSCPPWELWGMGLEGVCQPDSVLGLFVFYWELTWTFKHWRTKVLSGAMELVELG